MFIVAGIIAFGILIIVHELGHFAAARALGVKVNEFAVGMGPKILKKQGRETLYSLRALPLGGFCAMEGEDEETDDERAFTRQKRWKRIVILVAGSAANLLFGFILVLILTANIKAVSSPTVTKLSDGFPVTGENGLMVGDTILTIDGERIYYTNDFSMFMSLVGENGGVVDMTVRRGGETVHLNNYTLERRMYPGETDPKFGITFDTIEANAWTKLKYSCYTTGNFVRLVRVSLQQLISGKAGLRDLSGPVGIVSEINRSAQETAREANSLLAAVPDIVYFTAFIAVNLAVMNMLPIPALDGGRILFIAISFVIEKLIRRRVNPKYEGYIHATAFVLLIGLMIFVLVNDVVKIVGG